MSFFEPGFVRRTRQHHALEHATITVLMRRNPTVQLVGGRSTPLGFFVYGQVDTPPLEAAAQEALNRLQAGQAELAIHPNCGTNLVTTGALAGLAAFTTGAIGRRRKVSLWDQIPAAILAATGALLAGRPLGALLQARVTTLADVRDLRIGPITRRTFRKWVIHFVTVEAVS